MPAARVPTKQILKRLRRRPGHGCLGLVGLIVLAGILRCDARSPLKLMSTNYAFDPGPLPANSLKGVTVVIDPGHGGEDPGTIQGGVYEATLTYRTAATLARVLRAAGAKTHFTVRSAALTEKGSPHAPRDASPVTAPNRPLRSAKDNPEDIYARADLAARYWEKKARPLYFVSLHFDSRDPGIRGGHALWDLPERSGQPSRLAKIIATRLGQAELNRSFPAFPQMQKLGVLSPARNPVPDRVLVECATLSDPDDRKLALDPKWRQALCHVLAHAIYETKKR
ncbi:MAG: N-acetylmuramoyl-L-alanine amidase [Armatimonas sp.]